MFVTPCFLSATVLSSAIAKGNFLHLITPLDVFSILCGYALYLAV